VITAIQGRWPDRESEVIIQQDGASAHIAAGDPDFRLHAEAELWRIRLLTQPAKSPDLNVPGLSFFGHCRQHSGCLEWKIQWMDLSDRYR